MLCSEKYLDNCRRNPASKCSRSLCRNGHYVIVSYDLIFPTTWAESGTRYKKTSMNRKRPQFLEDLYKMYSRVQPQVFQWPNVGSSPSHCKRSLDNVGTFFNQSFRRNLGFPFVSMSPSLFPSIYPSVYPSSYACLLPSPLRSFINLRRLIYDHKIILAQLKIFTCTYLQNQIRWKTLFFDSLVQYHRKYFGDI